MTEFVEVKTADLVGAALDWAVAKAEGKFAGFAFRYSTDWSQGGPLIEKYMRNSGVFCDGLWQHVGFYKCSFEDGGAVSIGHTPLIAACRAIVASVLGETVSVPKELLS